MPILGVLFDLGGTLIDTSDPIGWTELAKGLGLDLEADHLAHSFREVEAERDRNPSPSPEGEAWRETLARASGREVPAGVGEQFLANWRASGFEPPLFSDARYCLERFQEEGLAMGVVSNSENADRVLGHLKRTGIARFFSAVVSSGTEGVRKPDPRIFRLGTERLHLPPGQVVYVGDLEHTDARASRAAGLVGVWLNRFGWGFGEDPPEITSLAELPGWVRLRPEP